MFGNFEKTLDEKNRIVIPTNFREELGSIVYVSLGMDKVIEIRSKEEFEKIEAKINQGNGIQKIVRDFKRFFFTNTTVVSLDKQGRILLPKTLLDSTAIKNEVYLLGVGKKIEIWPADRYAAYVAKNNEQETIEEWETALAEAGVEL